MICLHRKRRIGKFREIKACVRHKRVWVDWEAMGMAKASAYFSQRSVGDTYSKEDKAILEKICAS